MRLVLVPVLLGSVLLACNALVGFDDLEKILGPPAPEATDGPDDAGTTTKVRDGGTLADGAIVPSGPRCDPAKPFGAPVALKGPVSSASHDGSATLTADELTMIFQRSTADSSGTFLLARRSTDTDDFGEPIELTDLVSADLGFNPTMTSDGLNIFWTQKVTSTHVQIFHASRKTTGVNFSGVALFDPLSGSFDDNEPSVAQDGSELFIATNRGGGAPHLFHSVRDNGGIYQAPTELEELASDGREDTTALTADGLTLYFSSTRSGGVGHSDVYTAQRTTKSEPFSNIQLVPNVNTGDYDVPTWISPDTCRLYITKIGAAPGDILVASRPL